jgi:hypothetical protein
VVHPQLRALLDERVQREARRRFAEEVARYARDERVIATGAAD